MKLPVSNTNAPVWRDITVKSELPSDLKPLEELSKNLWWSGIAKENLCSVTLIPNCGALRVRTR